MALKFKCKNCGNDVVVNYVEIGETAQCKSCGADNIVPEDAQIVGEYRKPLKREFSEVLGKEHAEFEPITEENSSDRGFWSVVFDASFSEFITTRVIKLLYFLCIFASSGSAIFAFIIGLGLMESRHMGAAGLLVILSSPLVFLLNVLIFRVLLELVLVVFRIAENTSHLAKS